MRPIEARRKSSGFGALSASKLLSALAFCVLQVLTAASLAAPSIKPAEFEAELATALERVTELKFLKAEAEKLGVKAYLFGGTAASFAHYVKDDMLRRRGATGYPAERFDYDFTSIFRSTQDLDVVIDGPREKIDELSMKMRNRYPHFIGDKRNKWELRSLRESTGTPSAPGYKEALLESAEFSLQHTDSHSTGLILVNESAGDPRVRDLRDWRSLAPKFEQDVLRGRLHYYHSDRHFETPRAAAGKNPEIFSVVRALTKAFQYDLTFDREALAEMKKIVDATDFEAIKQDYDNVRRLIDMGKKLFLHSVDVERTWNTLESLGLRTKLMGFDSAQTLNSMAWLMNKEPLRTQVLGTGSGRTAADIARERGLTQLVVSHETNGFLAYESIMRSRAGVPNFYVSRPSQPGEAAVLGWGVYTMIGRKGARGTQITVRMTVDPRAREGQDFELHNDVVLVRNRAAVKTIFESIDLSTLGFLKEISSGKAFEGDLALLETFRRRLARNPEVLSAVDKRAILDLIDKGGTDLRVLAEVARLKIDVGVPAETYIEKLVTIDATKAENLDVERSFLDGLTDLIQKSTPAQRQRLNALVRDKLGSSLARWGRVVDAYDAAGLSSSVTEGEREIAKVEAALVTRFGEKPKIDAALVARSLFSAGQILEIAETLEMGRGDYELSEKIKSEFRRVVPVFAARATKHDVDYMKTITWVGKEFWIAFLNTAKLPHRDQALLLNNSFRVKTKRGEKLPSFNEKDAVDYFKLLAERFVRENANYEALHRLLIDSQNLRDADSWRARNREKMDAGVIDLELEIAMAALERSTTASEVVDIAYQIRSRLNSEADNDAETLKALVEKFSRFGAVTEKTVRAIQHLYHENMTLAFLMKAGELATTAQGLFDVMTQDRWHLDQYKKNKAGGYSMLGQERDTKIFNALWKRFGQKFVSLNPTAAHWELIAEHKIYLPELEPGVGPYQKVKRTRVGKCDSLFL